MYKWRYKYIYFFKLTDVGKMRTRVINFVFENIDISINTS